MQRTVAPGSSLKDEGSPFSVLSGPPEFQAARVAQQPSCVVGPLGLLCICMDRKAVTEGKNTLFYLKVVLLKMYNPEAILDSIW